MHNIDLYAVTGVFVVWSLAKDIKKTKKSLLKAWISFENMMPQFLGIITLVGIIIAILNPQVVSKIIGSSSGWFGVILASIVGAITLIPGFIAFPTAVMLLQSGTGYKQASIVIIRQVD